MARLINAWPTEIAFTKNSSEGLNIAANAVPLRAADTALMLADDHPDNACAWLNLSRKGVNVRFIEDCAKDEFFGHPENRQERTREFLSKIAQH